MNLADFTNQYPINKTICFSLIPQGNTLKNIEEDKLLEMDQKRAVEFAIAKKVLDRYHKAYIESRLTE